MKSHAKQKRRIKPGPKPRPKTARLARRALAPIRGALLSLPSESQAAVPPDYPEISDLHRRAYLVALATDPRFGRAAALAGIDVRTGWLYRQDPDRTWQALLKEARELGMRRAIDEVVRRGLEGWEEPVYQQGRMVGTVRKFDSRLLEMYLKAYYPERFRERLEHSTPPGQPLEVRAVPVDLTKLTTEELDALERIHRRLAESGGPQG